MGRANQIEHGTLNGAGGIGGLLARTTFGHELPGAPTTSFYHADGKGNITGLIYPLGAVVAIYQYDPFGNLISANGSLAALNKYRFSSKRWDANADLYYYGYRFYDPNSQRWVNRDPIHELGGINLFQYAFNNPLSLIDPFGLCPPPGAGMEGGMAETNPGGINDWSGLRFSGNPSTGQLTEQNNDSPKLVAAAIAAGVAATAFTPTPIETVDIAAILAGVPIFYEIGSIVYEDFHRDFTEDTDSTGEGTPEPKHDSCEAP